MSRITAAITAIGGYVPKDILTNSDLEKMVDTSDEWITTRTGIKERHILKEPGKGSSDIAVEAVKELLVKRGISAKEIELVIFATVTGDLIFPASANILCDKIGATNAWGFDLGAACSGFLYALQTGAQFIQAGTHKKVLVVGVDKMSAIIDYQDRNTCIIFGDGGGAVLLEPNEEGLGIQDAILRSDGSGREFLFQKSGGSLRPPTIETVTNREHYVYQEGKTVFKFAVTNMADVSKRIMEQNNLSSNDVNWLLAHQANKRIIDYTAETMGLPSEKVLMNIQRYGNTTSGTIPLLFKDYEKQFKKGDNLILATFGGGFTWGSIYLKWAYDPK
ncbi:MAG: ketoacyl-ACP synthase III [Bacteroidia bacterium]|nr:ketoacyl-ACP synthase III [Bacteroidia bacterium]MCO5253420.1 ketoacyl-ACP synthase III [Bacteroidota bacterium]MCZ2129876.1 ketoacyl-ACP synthase III [Bacteroidia bacterium]